MSMLGVTDIQQEQEKVITTPSGPSRWRAWIEGYLAGMMITAVAAPWIGTAVLCIIAIGYRTSNGSAVLLGLAGGLLGWCSLAVVAKQFVVIHRAHPAVYHQLCSRFAVLKAQMKVIEQKLKGRTEDPIQYAYAEAKTCCCLLQTVLGDSPPTNDCNPRDWIGASGYIRLWEQLHRAEEVLILLAPLETVLADAWSDQLRLEGSNIENRQVLLENLQGGVQELNNLKRERAKQASEEHSRKVFLQQAERESTIRVMLRYVRRSINEFRDERWFGLVQARNRLLKTVALTGCVCFAMAALAVMEDVQSSYLTTGVVFFLVGAIVGLFNQLRLDASATTATEDYGLATARLVHTPLFSGLAAIVGVLVIPLLSFLATSLPNGTSPTPSTLPLSTVFTLTPVSLVLAVIFGVSPTVLLMRLQREAEQYKADLRSSEPLTQGSAGNSNASAETSIFVAQASAANLAKSQTQNGAQQRTDGQASAQPQTDGNVTAQEQRSGH